MKSQDVLRNTLRRIDGRGYKAYEDIKGSYDFDSYRLTIDYVQADPFAPPSQVIVHVAHSVACFPENLFANSVRKTALEDYLTRRFYALSAGSRAGWWRLAPPVTGSSS